MPETPRPASRLLSPRRALLYGTVLLLALLLACEATGWRFLRQPLQQQMALRLHRDVRLGDGFRLHLLGGVRLYADRLAIGTADWDRAQSGQDFFLTARDIRLNFSYGALLHPQQDGRRVLRVRGIEVGNVEARLVRLRDGRRNWQFEHPGRKDGRPGGTGLDIAHLVVHEGRLRLDDAPARLALEATARTDEGRDRQGAGLRVSASGLYRDQHFTASATSPGALPLLSDRGGTRPVALVFDLRLAAPDAAGPASTLHVEGRARDLLRFDGLEGRFRLQGASLAAVGDALGVTLPSTDRFRMIGAVAREDRVWQVGVDTFTVARTQLAGEFRYDPRGARPLLSGQLRGRRLVLADLAPAFGASPAADRRPEAGPDKPRLLPQRDFDLPALHRMDADVAVRLTRVELAGERLKPLEPLEGRLQLANGVLQLTGLKARTADGELTGQVRLDARPDPPRWKADLAWSGIRLGQWVRARNRLAAANERLPAGPSGGTAPPPFVTGDLAGKATVGGSGRSTARLLGSLDGRVMLWVRHGELSQLLIEALGLDIAQALGLVIKGDENIPMYCAALSFKAEAGQLRAETGLVDTPDSLILLRGDISLASERLDLTLEARPHDRSPLSVRAPIHVRGTFSDPSVRPDMKQVGGKAVLATLLGTLLAPLAALLPLVDPGAAPEGQGCARTLARLKQDPAAPAGMKRALRGQ